MRLTTELINASVSFINPLGERELDLRGHKISTIENMGAARDNTAIDLTDNDIATLGNFPLLPVVRTIAVANNRIQQIQATLSAALPNLETLSLINNKLTELSDLDPLSGFTHLKTISIIRNPVVNKEHYRHWVIWLCPSVTHFDFSKVKDSERREARELFGTRDEPTELARKIMSLKAKTIHAAISATTETKDGEGDKKTYPEDVRARFYEAVRKAKTEDEITMLEKHFQDGTLPKSILEGPDEGTAKDPDAMET